VNTLIYHTHPHIGHSKGTTVQWSITPGKIKISEFPVNMHIYIFRKFTIFTTQFVRTTSETTEQNFMELGSYYGHNM
jgi:hypothetical protein